MSKNRVDLLALQKSNTWDQVEWIVPLVAALDGGGNSTWQTVNHVNYYNERMLNRLTGKSVGSGASSNEATFGEPDAGGGDEREWRENDARTHAIASELSAAIAALTDADLDKPYGSSTLGEKLARWMLHGAYYSVQIVLIRKQHEIDYLNGVLFVDRF
ncbi:DinB family protein [Paenibacillus arenilitoris]|uniref:DinB family protein n=1 Tax=Paenibacillus arenilitoris TaxID=2772299 RepID=A0A927CNE5_9BACL|nr:DinB family protein [Paenibacillus arenilitoris]MBD2871273.1 DinB family protein [Paenibacillus arenilitoris]